MDRIKFNLPQPIPYFNTTIVKGSFIVHYPDGFCHWALYTEDNNQVMAGNAKFPNDLLQNDWTTSDEPLIEWLINEAPWQPKAAVLEYKGEDKPADNQVPSDVQP